MEDLLPQPAVSVCNSRQIQSSNSKNINDKNMTDNPTESNTNRMGSGSGTGTGFGVGINTKLKKDNIFSEEIYDEQPNLQSRSKTNLEGLNRSNINNSNNKNNDNNESINNFNIDNNHIDEHEIDYDIINRTTAAAKLLRNAFGDPGPDNKFNSPLGIWDKGDFKSVGKFFFNVFLLFFNFPLFSPD